MRTITFRLPLNTATQVIMATNRADTLDPALLRPGRLDRKIEFPLPSRREKRLIFQTVTSKMNLGSDVDLEDCMLQIPLFGLLTYNWWQMSRDQISWRPQKSHRFVKLQDYKVS
jgi:hypothetical protein